MGHDRRDVLFMKPSNYCEILIPLQHDHERHWPPVHQERLYASALPDSSYRIESIPYFALDLAFADIVQASLDGAYPLMSRVLQHTGNSTFRVMFDANEKGALHQLAETLQSQGCRTEEHRKLPLLTLAVPPSVDIVNVYDLLDRGATAGQWDYEVGFDFVAHWTDAARSGHPIPFPE